MNLTQYSSSKLSQSVRAIGKTFATRRGSHWILTVLVCLSLLTPGASGFASASALAIGPEAAIESSAALPVVDTNVDLNLPVNTTAVIDASFLHASQAGKLPSELVFTIVINVIQGTLKLNDTALVQGSTFTQGDIDAGVLIYTAPASVSTISFTFHVSDGVDVSEDMVFTLHINKPEPTSEPTGFQAVADSISQITTTWTDVPGGAAPDGYLVLCSPMSPPTAPMDTTAPINNTCTDGSGSIHVPQGVGQVTWEGLNSETTYSFAIFPYAQTDYTQTTGSFFDYFTGPGAPPVPPTASATTFQTYSISGTITDGTFAIMGALVDAGNGHTAYSGEDGTYTLTGLIPGNYVLSASLPCATFTPVSLSVAVDEVNNHVSGKDFIGTLFPCIRGTVTDGANPLVGIVISDGSGLTATTNEYGSYTIPVTNNWSGTLAPALLNVTFIPDQRTYTDVTTDQNDQGYTGIRLSISVDRFTAAWGGITGATGYSLDVATDPGFTSFVLGYQNRDVGNNTQSVVTGLSPRTHYYYRVRAHDSIQTIRNSAVTEVLTIAPWVYLFPMVSR